MPDRQHSWHLFSVRLDPAVWTQGRDRVHRPAQGAQGSAARCTGSRCTAALLPRDLRAVARGVPGRSATLWPRLVSLPLFPGMTRRTRSMRSPRRFRRNCVPSIPCPRCSSRRPPPRWRRSTRARSPRARSPRSAMTSSCVITGGCSRARPMRGRGCIHGRPARGVLRRRRVSQRVERVPPQGAGADRAAPATPPPAVRAARRPSLTRIGSGGHHPRASSCGRPARDATGLPASGCWRFRDRPRRPRIRRRTRRAAPRQNRARTRGFEADEPDRASGQCPRDSLLRRSRLEPTEHDELDGCMAKTLRLKE